MEGLTVAREAYKWWSIKRPVGWTEDQHIENPHINCVGAYERALAGAVAKWAQARAAALTKSTL